MQTKRKKAALVVTLGLGVLFSSMLPTAGAYAAEDPAGKGGECAPMVAVNGAPAPNLAASPAGVVAEPTCGASRCNFWGGAICYMPGPYPHL